MKQEKELRRDAPADQKPKEKRDWKYWLNEWESYAATAVLIVLLAMLTWQVIARYLFKLSFSWLEEVAIVLYVLMSYLGVSSAVRHRKHIAVDALSSALPFKARKALLIFAQVIFLAFCVWIIMTYKDIISILGNGTTAMVHIPLKVCYGVIPFCMVMTAVRIVQEILRLSKENETELGATKPIMDLDAMERAYQEEQAKLQGKKEDDEQ